MPHPFDSIAPSPDAQHAARFTYSGEIRFGPAYFALSVDSYAFPERIFNDVSLWSPASALLAVQEWLTIDYSDGPVTALVVIDLASKREARVAQVQKGFLVPIEFADSLLVYRADYGGQSGTERLNIDVTHITQWNALRWQ